MPLQPLVIDGRTIMVTLRQGEDTAAMAHMQVENKRRLDVTLRRMYVEGRQFDAHNAETEKAECIEDGKLLPEHMRVHAYSSQIKDALEFVAGQLAESFAMVADDDEVQQVLEDALRASDQWSGLNDDDEISVDTPLRDALIAGDVCVEVKWDPIEQTCWAEVWESEQIDFVYRRRGRLEKVVRSEIVWVVDDTGTEREVIEKIEYRLAVNEFGQMECRKETYWDDDEAPQSVDWLGLPFIPWVCIKGLSRTLRAERGESIITDQCMRHADRYNAVEHVSYLNARYNSHGNLAVVGDAAHLTIENADGVNKDVADVLSFPGGTSVTSITLPTDPSMIEHQRQVLAEAIYNEFGLTRVEPDTIETLGGVSGYALEILNRKTEGTFREIRKEWVSGFKTLLGMILDVTAYKRDVRIIALIDGAEVTLDDDEIPGEALIVSNAFWLIDPQAVFPNRGIEIRMGTGYIVDDVLIRDDYVAGLISRREALRQRGYDEADIDQIVKEIEVEAPPEPEIGVFSGGARAGSTVGTATAP